MPEERPEEPASIRGHRSAHGLRFALVASVFNELVTRQLVDQALTTLLTCGADRREVIVSWVPGAFELPLIAKRLAVTGRYDAVLCLGAVIRGETSHDQLVSETAAHGISQVALETGVPVIFGVVTAETMDQALERASVGKQNRGRSAALAAVEMATLIRQLK